MTRNEIFVLFIPITYLVIIFGAAATEWVMNKLAQWRKR